MELSPIYSTSVYLGDHSSLSSHPLLNQKVSGQEIRANSYTICNHDLYGLTYSYTHFCIAFVFYSLCFVQPLFCIAFGFQTKLKSSLKKGVPIMFRKKKQIRLFADINIIVFICIIIPVMQKHIQGPGCVTCCWL